MFEFMNITKALSDENRVRILMALDGRELCVCQIIELLDLAPSTVSKHLFILRNARLIDSRKDGRWMYYRLADPKNGTVAADALEWVMASIDNEPRVQTDRNQLEAILKQPKELLCGP